MIDLKINGIDVTVDRGTTLLEAAQFLGLPIPTLCHMEGLTPYGACRLCLVEVTKRDWPSIQPSCLYPVQEGIEVETESERVKKTRKIMLELYLARSPESKAIIEIAHEYGVRDTRFKLKETRDCVLCGLCVRACADHREG